ncbi:MAG: heme ABC transporter permease [Alphaproteobacteria bacterium]|nr:heme ABC transporter permease [Alphaproteobacteria bacterium]
MWSFANPQRFLGLSRRLVPWLASATGLLFAAGLLDALVLSPPDYQQGESVRMMYVHVPASWMALFVYTLMAGASLVFLVWRHALADVAARAAAPLGAGFTAVSLATGSLWGKPMWGTFWVWDARLTSVLVLFFLYIGYIALRGAIEDETRAGRAGAVLALVGFVNVPIIKFSVDWWNTLHQPASVSRLDAPAIDASILTPLLLMAAAYMALFATLLLLRMETEIYARRVRAAAMREVAAAQARDETGEAAGAAARP